MVDLYYEANTCAVDHKLRVMRFSMNKQQSTHGLSGEQVILIVVIKAPFELDCSTSRGLEEHQNTLHI